MGLPSAEHAARPGRLGLQHARGSSTPRCPTSECQRFPRVCWSLRADPETRWQPHEKETDGDNKSETEEAKKWRLLADEGVNIRSAAGQQFSRDPNAGKSADYAGLTNAAKQAFKNEWAKQMHTMVLKKIVKEKSWRTVDSNKGSYEPFAIIVKREGGGGRLDSRPLQAMPPHAYAWRDLGFREIR